MKQHIKKLLREGLIREELSDDEMNNLKRFIDSGDESNIEMAFMIASGHGEDAENALFTYWYNSMNSMNLTWDELKNLEELYLGGNKLESLPDNIGNLTNLKKLYLGYNQLKSLPDSIGNLTNLKYLNLSKNQLKDLPESIGKLKKLQRLHLYGNQLSDEEKARIKKLLPDTDIYF